MMDEKTVRLMVCLAVLAQALADRLAFLPGVGENQALFPPGMLENISHPRIGRLRRPVRGRLRRQRLRKIFLSFVRLGVCVEKMLHGQTPHFLLPLKPGNHRPPAAACRQKPACRLRISDGGGEADSPGTAARRSAEPFYEAEGLHSPVSPQQGVDLVNDDKPQIAEQSRNLHVLVDHERLQGLRRDLKNAGWPAQKLPLPGLGRVAVPPGHGDPRLLAQFIQPSELVVDQRLQGGDIERPHTGGGILLHQGQNGEKCRLRLSRRRGRGQKHIVLCAENGFSGGILHPSQGLPSGPVYIVLNKRGISLKHIHKVNSI